MANLIYRSVLILAIIFLFIGLSAIPSSAINLKLEKPSFKSLTGGNTLYVGGSGPNNYTTIQSAIDDAKSDDTVFVYDDSSPYYENVVVNKSINLIGENKLSTIIDGNYNKSSVVDIRETGVTVSGFKIMKCTLYCIVIWEYENAVIKDNIISIGIDNDHYNSKGIYLWKSKNNLIKDNKIYNSKGLGDGISSYTSERDSFYNNITGNEIFGFYWGIHLKDYNDVIVSNNYIHNNKYMGICLSNSANTLISGNIILENGYGGHYGGGIIITSSENITIINNHISNNSYYYGIYLGNSSNNKIQYNNFINNDRDAYFRDSTTNIWYNNYWNKPRIFPKLIFGVFYFRYFILRWVNFDLKPAKEPYEIPTI